MSSAFVRLVILRPQYRIKARIKKARARPTTKIIRASSQGYLARRFHPFSSQPGSQAGTATADADAVSIENIPLF
jgi:hypothetical protein